jgi:signal transduction histidine kinase
MLLLAALLATLPLAAALFLANAREQMEQSAGAEVDADVAALDKLTDIDSVVAAIEVLEERGARAADGGLVYFLIDPENGTPIAGNLEEWPHSFPRRATARARAFEENGKAMVGRVTVLDGHFPLFTGRRIDGLSAMRNQTLQVVALLTTITLMAVLVLALLSIRASARRIARIEGALTAFSSGHRAIRIADTGHDALGIVSTRVDALLDLVGEKLRSHELIAEHIAHELRGPVARATATIRNGLADDAVAVARVAMDELLQMIDGVLFITEMRTRELARDRVALDGVAAEIAELYEVVCEDRGMTLRRELAAAPVLGERALIERLVANLVDNACKYAPRGSQILVRTHADDAGTILEISDRGDGLAGLPETPGLLLARGSAARLAGGTGLGLALVLRIAERHEANVQFADRIDGGLTVTVRFPSLALDMVARPSTYESAAQ